MLKRYGLWERARFQGGGGSGGGGTQQSSTTVQQQLSPEQRNLISAVTPQLLDFAKNPPTDYSGEKVAALTPEQLQAQTMALGAAAGPAQQIADRALQTSDFLSGPNMYASSNPYLQSAIQAAITPQIQSFQDVTMPAIRAAATNSGQFGGSRQGIAEGIASRGLTQSIANTGATMANANYQAAQDATVKALGLAPQTQALSLTPSTIYSGVGAQNQAQQQALINEEVQRYINSQMLPYLAAKDVAGIAFGMPGGSSTATSIGPAASSGASPLMSGLGGAASGAALGSMIMPGWGTAIGGGAGLLMGLLG